MTVRLGRVERLWRYRDGEDSQELDSKHNLLAHTHACTSVRSFIHYWGWMAAAAYLKDETDSAASR